MMKVDLTKSEVETLSELLWCNPCESKCVMGYKKIDCFDIDRKGEYKCELKRNILSIEKKLGLQDYESTDSKGGLNMRDEDVNLLFRALSKILYNQQKILRHVGVSKCDSEWGCHDDYLTRNSTFVK